MLKLYAFLFIVAILSGVGYGAYYYYNDTQTRIATLRENNAKLETVNKQIGDSNFIKNIKDYYKSQTAETM